MFVESNQSRINWVLFLLSFQVVVANRKWIFFFGWNENRYIVYKMKINRMVKVNEWLIRIDTFLLLFLVIKIINHRLGTYWTHHNLSRIAIITIFISVKIGVSFYCSSLFGVFFSIFVYFCSSVYHQLFPDSVSHCCCYYYYYHQVPGSFLLLMMMMIR